MAGGVGLEPISLITPITTVFARPEGARVLALTQMLEASATLNASSSACCIMEKRASTPLRDGDKDIPPAHSTS